VGMRPGRRRGCESSRGGLSEILLGAEVRITNLGSVDGYQIGRTICKGHRTCCLSRRINPETTAIIVKSSNVARLRTTHRRYGGRLVRAVFL
jgi:hypothetical protein